MPKDDKNDEKSLSQEVKDQIARDNDKAAEQASAAKERDYDEAERPRGESSSGGKTVTVACKLPNGLVLRTHRMVPHREPAPGGVQETTIAMADSREYEVKGNASPYGSAPSGQVIGGVIGYALTPNIPKDFWDAWFEQNKHSDIVKNGLIFAHVNGNKTADQAREQVKVRSGFEGIDPANPPQVSRQFKIAQGSTKE